MNIAPGSCIVAKIGSALLTKQDGGFARENFSQLVDGLLTLRAQGHPLVIVSSGAISLGLSALGFSQRPRDLANLQAAAAAGQSHLMAAFEQAFAHKGLHSAQVLLTHADLADRRRYLNARRALSVLLRRGLIPVVNENDTVGVDEIKVGDNDSLAAEIVGLVDAELLILLSTAAGLFDRDPEHANAKLIPLVHKIEARHRQAAGGAGQYGTGGMATKIVAAERAAQYAAKTWICDGHKASCLQDFNSSKASGTLFDLDDSRALTARKLWLSQTLRPQGTLYIDAGASEALNSGKKSLLPVGLLRCEGDFHRGDQVRIIDPQDHEIGRGLVAYDARETQRIAGQHADKILSVLGYRYGDELVHRDDLVLHDQEDPDIRGDDEKSQGNSGDKT